MNHCATEDAKAAEDALNALYQKILDDYQDDLILVEKIKAAQEAWVAFRKAHSAAIFPLSENPEIAQAEYGSVFPMCRSIVIESMVRERIAQLRAWTDGIQPGDVCVGSRRFNAE